MKKLMQNLREALENWLRQRDWKSGMPKRQHPDKRTRDFFRRRLG